MSDRWSYSRISTFEKCPRAYRYKYIDHEREAFESIEAFMGSRVHDTIEYLFSQEGRPVSLDEALKHYTKSWNTRWIEAQTPRCSAAGLPNPMKPIKVVRGGETPEQYAALGESTLRNFYPRYVEDPFRTVGLEAPCEIKLGGRYDFHGYIDRLAIDDCDEWWVIDYKTGKNAPAEFIGKEADQVRAYGLAILSKNPATERVHLRLDYVRADVIREGVITREDMAKVEKQLVSRIEAAEVKHYPTRVSALCSWCGFGELCPDGPGKNKKQGTAKLPF